MSKHWLIRVGDGYHFWSSSQFNIWGINSEYSDSKGFIKSVNENDRLWFVKGKSKGLLIGVATFTNIQKREFGLTLSNEELGWTDYDGKWDYEVHYKDLQDITSYNLCSEIKSPGNIRKYNEKCKVNLPVEYENIKGNDVYKNSSLNKEQIT
jgi:hypothetical protein